MKTFSPRPFAFAPLFKFTSPLQLLSQAHHFFPPNDINSSRKGQKYHCFSEKLQTVKIETQDMNVVSPRCNYYYFFG